LPRALAVAGHAEDLGIVPEVTALLLGNVALYHHKRAEFSKAKKLYEKALAIEENTFGPDHSNVAIRVNNFGLVLQAMGDLDGAKMHFERALEIFRDKLGEDHPSTKTVKGNLEEVQHR